MNKEELLKELSIKVNSGEIGRGELMNLFNFSPIQQIGEVETKKPSQFSFTKMLYVLGAAIVLVGICFFVAQIWDDIGSFGRISVTLGLGLLTTAIGSLLLKQKPDENIGSIFHFIGGMLIPGGALVTIYELSDGGYHPWVIAITFVVIFVFYLLLNFVHKNPVLTFFAIGNGTASIYLAVEAMIGREFYNADDLYAYLTMVIGASYLLLAHAFRSGWNSKLIGALHFFGITGFLGAAFSQVHNSFPWQMVFFLFVLCGLFLSVYMKSRIILIMSTLFLVAHFSYITSKYFADSLGWPISLVILGFVFIGLGYASISINKKYIKTI